MAVLYTEFDNIYCFDHFKANFTYPKKLVHSSLEDECFRSYPGVRYRKLNILLGANGSGKSSLGRALHRVFLFLSRKEKGALLEAVCDSTKEAFVLIDFAFSDGLFCRVEIRIGIDKEVSIRYRPLNMRASDTYDSLVARLPEDVPFENYLSVIESIEVGGWNFRFPAIEVSGAETIDCYVPEDEKEALRGIMENVLKTFDPSVLRVAISKELNDSFIAYLANGKQVAITDGNKLSELRYLSSGTKYGVNIAALLHNMKIGANGFYFVDEHFSYVGSDIEIGCLALMVGYLGDGDQLFFTSHNEELLKLNYPHHSFNFMKKTVLEDGRIQIEMLNAGDFEKRNTVNLKNLFDNDYFGVAPDLSSLYCAEA